MSSNATAIGTGADVCNDIDPVVQHYRCSEELIRFRVGGFLKKPSGFFRFGEDIVCYGQTVGAVSPIAKGALFDASQHVEGNGHGLLLPFDGRQVVDNLRYELYVKSGNRLIERAWVKDLYYRLRPMLPVPLRKHLQKLYLSDWKQIAFPSWPVDRTVDMLLEKLLMLTMRFLGIERLPFIWFWPDGFSACTIMTHDVETTAGRDFCAATMDLDDAFGIKASFQVVPEKRYEVPAAYLHAIRERGFEVNVQGLDHDGDLFKDHPAFIEHAKKINRYASLYKAKGFRSPILYRNAEWFRELDFSYDMSAPNVAHLEAQRGGCCTIMPYFLPGGLTELPVTMTEDYTLFHILKDYSIALWKQQMDIVASRHGLMCFIIHPDYIISNRPQRVFQLLLEQIARRCSDDRVWAALPRDVDRWWKDRSQMQLISTPQGWEIEGPGSDHARVAYATIEDDRLVYEF